MSTTSELTVGDRGRVVLPADLRRRAGLTVGTKLVAIDGDDGIVLLTREQLKRRVRDQLSGASLVDSLIDDRRRAAQLEDSEAPAP